MRIVIDATGYASIGGYRWPNKIGYLGVWTDAQIEAARAANELLGLVDTRADSPSSAAVIAWEPGSVQNPFTLQSWVRARNDAHADAVVRCSRADLQHVLSILSQDYFRLWLVDPAANREPPMVAPELGLPPTVKLLGICYDGPHDGIPYSMSIFYDDTWHDPDNATAAAAAAAAPASTSTRSEAAAAGAGVPTALESDPPDDQIPGQIAIDDPDVDQAPPAGPTDPFPGIPAGLPDPAASSTPPAGSAGSAPSSASSSRPVAAAAQSASSDIASAPTSGPSLLSPGSPSGPVTTGVRLDGPAPEAGSRLLDDLRARVGVDPVPGLRSAMSAAAASSPTSPTRLDHAWIGQVMRETLDVADALDHAGAPAAAALLHQAAAHGMEVGRLLQLAGI